MTGCFKKIIKIIILIKPKSKKLSSLFKAKIVKRLTISLLSNSFSVDYQYIQMCNDTLIIFEEMDFKHTVKIYMKLYPTFNVYTRQKTSFLIDLMPQ